MTKRILVVDNHPMILRMMAGFLEKEGHEVMTASDGLAALSVLEVYSPEVIFVDLVMPNISGEKLCKIIRSMPRFQDTYIVVLSALAADDAIDYKAFGANACVAKGSMQSIQQHVLASLANADNVDQPDSAAIAGAGEVEQHPITQELLSSKKHFEAIVNHMSEGVFELTMEGRIIFVNPAALRLCKTAEEQLLATNFTELFDATEQQSIARLFSSPELLSHVNDEETPVLLHDRHIALNFLKVNHDEQDTLIAIAKDITSRYEAEKALYTSETRFRELFDNMRAGVAVYEAENIDASDFVIVDFNQSAERIENIQRDKIIGRSLLETFPGVTEFGLMDVLRRVWNSGKPEHLPVSMYKDHRLVGWRENYVYKLPSGEVVAIFEDVTAKKQAENKLAFESALNEAVARLSRMIISSASLEDFSQALLEEVQSLTHSKFGIVGFVDQESGDLHAAAFSPDISAECALMEGHFIMHKPKGLFGYVLKNKECLRVNSLEDDQRSAGYPEGHMRLERFLAAPALLEGKLIGVVAVANAEQDYDEKSQAAIEQFASFYAMSVQKHWSEEHIAHLAHHDPLTGLINRHLFPDRLAQAMVLAKRHGNKAALLYVDLDRFKEINDTSGHQAGDAVLKEVAQRIKNSIRASDTVARMGGDEFVIILQDVEKRSDAETVAQKLLGKLADPIPFKDKAFDVAASIGISLYPDDDKNIESLLQKADEAMYRTKKTAGSNFGFFNN